MKLPEDLMSVQDLATRLGISLHTAYAQVKAGEVPGVRHVGKRAIRIHRPTIERWIATGDRKAS